MYIHMYICTFIYVHNMYVIFGLMNICTLSYLGLLRQFGQYRIDILSSSMTNNIKLISSVSIWPTIMEIQIIVKKLSINTIAKRMSYNRENLTSINITLFLFKKNFFSYIKSRILQNFTYRVHRQYNLVCSQDNFKNLDKFHYENEKLVICILQLISSTVITNSQRTGIFGSL